jgi:hypothetical protein
MKKEETPNISDVVELKDAIPDRNLPSGVRGTIIHKHTADAYEIEIADAHGATIDMFSLRRDQFIIVWRSDLP